MEVSWGKFPVSKTTPDKGMKSGFESRQSDFQVHSFKEHPKAFGNGVLILQAVLLNYLLLTFLLNVPFSAEDFEPSLYFKIFVY